MAGLRRRYMQLMEVLVAAVIAAGLVTSASKILFASWDLCRSATRHAHLSQEVSLIRTRWRLFVHGHGGEGTWSATGNELSLGAARVSVERGGLVLADGGDEKRITLPEGMAAALSLEQQAGLADAAVLTLSWERTRQRRPDVVHTRIVACRAAQEGNR